MVFGVPRAAAAETMVFFAAALVFDALVLDGTRFRDVGPHPFWLFALLMAAHHGTLPGVFAVVLGALLAFSGNVPPRDPLQNQSAYLLAVLARPMVWFGSAVVLGELRMRQQRARDEIALELQGLREQANALVATNARLEEATERLRTNAAGQVQTTVSLFEAARSVESQHTGSVFGAVDGLIKSALSPTAYSLYLRSGDQLDLVVHNTDGKTAEAARMYALTDPLFAAVVQQKRIVHVADADGQRTLGKDGVLAGPLVDVDSGEVLGMLKVEAMPLHMLHLDTLTAFKALCEWIGSAYRKALQFEEANRARVTVPGSQLFSDAFYQSVSTFLLGLAERAHFEVSQLTVRVVFQKKADAAAIGPVRSIVEMAVTKGLRTTDLAFDYFDARAEYLVMLPMTPAANCQIVVDRLRERMQLAFADGGHVARVTITYEALYVPTPDDIKPWHRPLFRRTAPYETS